MTFDTIFEAYYNLYRLEKETPASDDDEYAIGLRLANEAVNRWENYDGTYWKELFSTLSTTDQGGDTTIVTNLGEYACPDDMREPGGFVILRNTSGQRVARYDVIEPQDVQFKSDLAKYCFFTGNPGTGFTLHLNPDPGTDVSGCTIDYTYYKQATKFAQGSDKTEMADPYFIVHRMLANRFRGSRNPYYNTAKQDAENALQMMQANNNSGNWGDPWALPDRSGTVWGA